MIDLLATRDFIQKNRIKINDEFLKVEDFEVFFGARLRQDKPIDGKLFITSGLYYSTVSKIEEKIYEKQPIFSLEKEPEEATQELTESIVDIPIFE